MKPKQCFSAFILFNILLISCTSNSNNPADKNDRRNTGSQPLSSVQSGIDSTGELSILRNLLEPRVDPGLDSLKRGYGSYGQKVKLTDALLCVDRFPDEMKRYAILKTWQKTNVRIKQSWMTTESEEFGGYDLVAWLLEVVRKYDSAGKGRNMSIKLVLGIYSDNFLLKYVPMSAAMRAKRKDRITVFLIPYMRKTEHYITGDDATAYELGGLQP